MQRNRRWMLVVLIGVTVLLAACTQTATSVSGSVKPAEIQPIEGTKLNRVILTEQAAKRLDIQTTTVREEQVSGTMRKVIPYAAVIYDLQGDTWIYINPEKLTYMRELITIDSIQGDLAILSAGPASGTEVVTVGVAELYGADTGIGK